MIETVRPHVTRRQHQEVLARKRRIRRKRRLARLRRIRIVRMLRSIRFWTKFCLFAFGLLLVSFWAKFAFVYNIPAYAQRGVLSHVGAYITVKPWWFGPPVFDLSAYQVPADEMVNLNPYDLLMERLGKYSGILSQPQFVWVARH
jgi:hypothetical protein